MPLAAQSQAPSPELFFETITAYQKTAALKAAIELDLFTAIAEGNTMAEELAKRCGASERGIRILCDYLVIVGFLTKQQGLYGLGPDSAAFLSRHSPFYLGTAVTFLTSPMLTDGFKDLTASVRKGGTVMSEGGSLAPENPLWVTFARSMAPMMALPAQLVAKLVGADSGQKWKVLGIASGHALFGIEIAKQNPNAEVAVVDWRNVLEVAKENAQAAGVASRFRTIPGSAFEVDFGTGYDLVLLPNFLHHFDVPACEKLLRKVYAALQSKGRAVAIEFVPNEDRVSPRVPASFSLTMLGTTPSGDAYTFPEFERMFRKAGFSGSELHSLAPTFLSAIMSHKDMKRDGSPAIGD